MRLRSVIGVVVLLLGILSFFVPLPITKTREIKAADASLAITTRHDEKLPPGVGVVMCGLGVILLLAASRNAS